MNARTATDVAIVGGGIMGASAALALRRMGIEVTVLERDACGAQASGVNYGGVRRQGRALAQLPLSWRAHNLWARLPELIGTDGEYVRSGHLKLARSDADMASLESYREKAEPFQLGLRMLSRSALHARYPWLGEGVVGGSLCPDDGHANPRVVSPAIARAAQRLGARVREHTSIEEIEHDGEGFTLFSANGERTRAPVLINCAGAWAGRIAERFGEAVPMAPAHPAMIVTEPLPPLITVNLGVEGGGLYARQAPSGQCVIGGARGYAVDERRSRPGRLAIESILRQATAIVPALAKTWVIRTWSGTEGYLPDKQPVIGASATTPGLFHAFGFGGAGFQLGLAVGEVLAELVRDGRTATPIEAFSIDRFRTS